MGVLGALLALPIAAGIRMVIEELRVDLPGDSSDNSRMEARDRAGERAFEELTAGASSKTAAAVATEIAETQIAADRRPARLQRRSRRPPPPRSPSAESMPTRTATNLAAKKHPAPRAGEGGKLLEVRGLEVRLPGNQPLSWRWTSTSKLARWSRSRRQWRRQDHPAPRPLRTRSAGAVWIHCDLRDSRGLRSTRSRSAARRAFRSPRCGRKHSPGAAARRATTRRRRGLGRGVPRPRRPAGRLGQQRRGRLAAQRRASAAIGRRQDARRWTEAPLSGRAVGWPGSVPGPTPRKAAAGLVCRGHWHRARHPRRGPRQRRLRSHSHSGTGGTDRCLAGALPLEELTSVQPRKRATSRSWSNTSSTL